MGSQPRHSIRANRLRSRREIAPRPATHPIDLDLAAIRDRLGVAMACAYVVSAALKSQHADSDLDAAVTIQRLVADEVHCQIERLERVLDAFQSGRSTQLTSSGRRP
jgi:hypothetical protein